MTTPEIPSNFCSTSPRPMTNHHELEEKPTRNRLLENLQIYTAILVSLFGIFTSWQSFRASEAAQENGRQLQAIDQRTKRVQEFSKRIQDQLPNLTDRDPAKAKIALASLYSLGETDLDKSILFTVAIVSESKDLRETITDLIASDPSASPEFKKDIETKLQKRLTAQSREAAAQDSTDNNNRVSGAKEEVKLLQQLTADRSQIDGWVYLGKVLPGSNNLAEDKTIKATSIPAVGGSVQADTSINLRDAGSRQGNIIGAISRNSTLKVEELKQRPIPNSKFVAVWARVSR